MLGSIFSLLLALTIPVTVSPSAGTALFPHPVQCVDIYTQANQNPFCVELVSNSGTDNGTIDSSSSASWMTKEVNSGGGTVGFSDLSSAVNTQPGGTNYGQDPAFSMFYNPNGVASIATTGLIEYINLTCDTSQYSCGHSYTSNGEAIWAPAAARGQNPNSDHHFASQGNPCQQAGLTSPVNKPNYAIAAGDRCEMDFWLVAPAKPATIPPTNTNGASFTFSGSGQCDMDARLGMYNASGSSASNICMGTAVNPADIVTAIQNNTWLPYALNTAVNCTENNYVPPASYFDGYETANGCPPEGARYRSKITDAQVNATSWTPAMKVLMRTAYHYGGIVTDTTGGYGNGFNVQTIGGSGYTYNDSTDTDTTDPWRWIADNGGTGTSSISNDNGGSELGTSISLSNISPYTFSSSFVWCQTPTLGSTVGTGGTMPKTCGNI